MMRRALNTLDYRLIDHGERVAYIVLKLFEKDVNYSHEQLVKICYLTLFHDIGAYKTEDLDALTNSDSLFQFEVAQTIHHSIYGFLFLKEHEFFEEFADAVLFHHLFYDKLLETDCMNKEIASAIFLADRLDMLMMRGRVKTPTQAIDFLRNGVFNQKLAYLLGELEEEEGTITKVLDRSYLRELVDFLNNIKPNSKRTQALVHILPHAIDFRSEHTVTHTTATVKISVMLANYCGLTEEEVTNVYLGALLHDVGKISVTTAILEKDSKLSDNEFNAMKDHVVLTEYILHGCVSEQVLHIASRHHEKLDGTGYPKKITEKELTLADRIVAVGDILSALMGKRSYKDPFPEEKVKAIVMDLAENGKLCKEVINQAMIHYKELEESVAIVSDEAVNKYEQSQIEAKNLLQKYEGYY